MVRIVPVKTPVVEEYAKSRTVEVEALVDVGTEHWPEEYVHAVEVEAPGVMPDCRRRPRAQASRRRAWRICWFKGDTSCSGGSEAGLGWISQSCIFCWLCHDARGWRSGALALRFRGR